MNALLMHPDRDFDLRAILCPSASALTQDLELATLLHAMAGDDKLIFEVARVAMLISSHIEVDAIPYRQDILRDCIQQQTIVRELYALAVNAIEGKRRHCISIFRNYPSGTLFDAIGAMEFFVAELKKLRVFVDRNAAGFQSAGFMNLFEMLRKEFEDEYFADIHRHLKELKFRNGVLVSAELGDGSEGINFLLGRRPLPYRPWYVRLLDRIVGAQSVGYTYRLHERDEAGARILSGMRDRGINQVANALAQSVDHIVSFFNMLRVELAFYVGCLNLYDALTARRMSMSFPHPQSPGTRQLRFRELHDVSLVLTKDGNITGNTLDADGKSLLVITGANQGGKSSFIRAIGLAQLMMQCGMFVTAESFSAEVCTALFTHYKREEDVTMKSGKLDEELSRMSGIADRITPDSMLLFNESFASTNEREGSEIAGQIVDALLDRRVKVLFVTHLYEFAHGMFERRRKGDIFLRAQRFDDGTRNFTIVEQEPLDTSYGEDLYGLVFVASDVYGCISLSSGEQPR